MPHSEKLSLDFGCLNCTIRRTMGRIMERMPRASAGERQNDRTTETTKPLKRAALSENGGPWGT